jgi:5-enolpyruvylshikimate-3-phosphate synthase
VTKAQVFPTVLIVLDVSAAIVYGVEGDVRRVVYWLAAAALTTAVTF